MKRPKDWHILSIGLLVLLPVFLAGCGAGGSNAPFVSGITLSPAGGVVAPGTAVTLTATVADTTKFKSALWTAPDGGTLEESTGLKVVWTAPTSVPVNKDYHLNLKVTQTNGLVDNQIVTIKVGTGTSGTSGFITGISLSGTGAVQPGDTVTLTATVSDSALLKSAQWAADGGTVTVPVGLKGVWVAPDPLAAAQDFHITLNATKTDGTVDSQVVTIHVAASTGTSTTAVRITSITTSAATVALGGTATLSVALSDTANLAYVGWTTDFGRLVQTVGTSVTWVAPVDAPLNSVAKITATAYSLTGETSPADVTLVVNSSSAPSTSGKNGLITDLKITSASGAVNPGDTVTMQATVDDTTQVSIIQWSADGGTLNNDRGTTATWVAPDVTGAQRVFVITATSTNIRGEKNSGSIRVVVKPKA